MHDNEKLEEHLGPSATASENRDQFAEQMPDSSNFSTSMSSSQPSGAYFLSSDPVSLSLQDSRQSSAVGTMKHGVGIQSSAVEQISAVSEIASGAEFKIPICILAILCPLHRYSFFIVQV